MESKLGRNKAEITIRHCRKCKEPIEIGNRRPNVYKRIQFCKACHIDYKLSF